MLCNAFYYFIIYYFIIAQLLLPLDAIFNCSEYTVSQKKTCHSCLRHNFGKRWSFFFHCWPQ